MQPSDFVTYRVSKKLFDLNIISRETFLSFATEFAKLIKSLRKEGDTAVDWDAVREMFDFDDYADVVPINAANLCPSIHNVQVFVNQMGIDMNKDVSIQKRTSVFATIIDFARALIANQLNINTDELAFMRNSTEANNVINNGLDFYDCGEVVIWSENHGTNNRAWEIRKQRNPNIEIITVDLTEATTDQEVIDRFVAEIKPGITRVVTFSEISNESGLRIPSKDLCKAVHDVDPTVHVHVDGAQGWGALQHDLQDMGCDSYAASAHKWFVGPKEAGILYMKKDRITNFWPNNFGYDAKIVLPTELYTDARRFETLGQRNDPTLMGLLYTAELLRRIGFDEIDLRIQYLVQRLVDGLLAMNYTLTTPLDPARRHGVVVVHFDDPDEGVALYEWLYAEHRIGVASTGGLRICPHIYNTEEHIDRLLAAINEYQSLPPDAKVPKKAAYRKK